MQSLYGSPPGRSFCAYKRNQNTVKGDSFPLDELLSVACSAGYERCKSIVRTAHRYAPKVAAGASAPSPSPSPVAGEGPSGQIAAYSGLRLGSVTFCASLLGKSQSLPPCGARKNLRAARLLDFFDRYGCSASLHPPLAALGSAPPFPSPAAGEGPSGQITACSTHRLDSVTSCYRFAVTQHKMRRRHLESVSAALYGRCFRIVRIQPQLKR